MNPLFADPDPRHALLAYDAEIAPKRGNPLLDTARLIYRAGRDILAPGGELNPTGGLVEPSVQGVRRAGDFVAEMVNPAPGIDRAVQAFGDGRYVDAFAEGVTAMPMIAHVASPAKSAKMGAKLAAKGDLPMDEASRMARAREMGFNPDQPYYHGTRSDFGQFGRIDGGNAYGDGYYFTRDPAEASRYATGEGVNRITIEGNAGPNVMPVNLRMQNPFNNRQPLTGAQLARIEQAVNEVHPGYFKKGELAKSFDRAYPPLGDNVLYQLPSRADARDILRRAGFDGMNTDMGTVVFEPSQIRSRFAAFDPAKRESGDLLAGLAPIGLGTVGALPLLASDER